jgi:Cu-Zn family superoxide dismutase
MVQVRTYSAILTALAVTACSRGAGDGMEMGAAGPKEVRAELMDSGGRVRATAGVKEEGEGLRVRVDAAGLAQGAYGAHLHTTGRCDPPGFESAGPHWNPTMRQHGKDNPAGSHKGDLPNLLVGADGRGSFEFVVPAARLTEAGERSLLDADGASVVVHASADDYRTDPSGNSGARIACGVLG